MWKPVILIENLFWLKGNLASWMFHGNFLLHTSIACEQKQRQGGWVCCANLVIVKQIYDLPLHQAVIAFLLRIIYWHPLPIWWQFLSDQSCLQTACNKVLFSAQAMFHYSIVQFIFFFCKLILHLNASNNYTKYGTMTYLVTKCHYWPSQTAKDDGKDMDKQWRKRWRRRQKVGRRHPDLLPGREEHGGG